MKQKPKFSLIFGLLVLGAIVFWLFIKQFMTFAPEPNSASAPSFGHGRIAIERSGGGGFYFDVDIASTPKQHAYGLMFRRSMPIDSGMLFVFDPPDDVSFWMKNTFIPLDMLFVGIDGRIVKIAEQAKPHDLTPIRSGEPVGAVIELNGGAAAQRGIMPGDNVRVFLPDDETKK